ELRLDLLDLVLRRLAKIGKLEELTRVVELALLLAVRAVRRDDGRELGALLVQLGELASVGEHRGGREERLDFFVAPRQGVELLEREHLESRRLKPPCGGDRP